MLIILLPVNLAVTPNIVARFVAAKKFDSACSGWPTSFLLDSIPLSISGSPVSGNAVSRSSHAGDITFTGGISGWRVSYVRAPDAPTNFNDQDLVAVIYDSRDIGRTFTLQCNSDDEFHTVVDCGSGSVISYIQTNPNADLKVFTDLEAPLVSILFSRNSYAANYSTWIESPPLGSLYDWNQNEEVRVVRKGNRNACGTQIKVCGRDFLETFVSMAYIWRRWQEWGIGEGHC